MKNIVRKDLVRKDLEYLLVVGESCDFPVFDIVSDKLEKSVRNKLADDNFMILNIIRDINDFKWRSKNFLK